MDFFLSFFVEFLVQLVLELVVALFDAKWARWWFNEEYWSVVARTFFYFVFGVSLGALAYAMFPYPLFGSSPSEQISLILVPINVALATVAVVRWAKNSWDGETELSQFWYSLILAYGFAGMRYTLLMRGV